MSLNPFMSKLSKHVQNWVFVLNHTVLPRQFTATWAYSKTLTPLNSILIVVTFKYKPKASQATLLPLRGWHINYIMAVLYESMPVIFGSSISFSVQKTTCEDLCFYNIQCIANIMLIFNTSGLCLSNQSHTGPE